MDLFQKSCRGVRKFLTAAVKKTQIFDQGFVSAGSFSEDYIPSEQKYFIVTVSLLKLTYF